MVKDAPTQIVVHKLDVDGSELWRYEGKLLERSETRVSLEAYFDRPDVQFEGLRLRRGDRFVETFYSDRWYNVFAVYDRERGALKGWYCNITRPARFDEGEVYAEDLALDLIVTPDGMQRVLDEADFAELNISRADRQNALQALSELRELAASRTGPFAP
jgi:predicted RNA-binding protein associated with RNAse of E/G family